VRISGTLRCCSGISPGWRRQPPCCRVGSRRAVHAWRLRPARSAGKGRPFRPRV
jgi:hypothetical protein